MQTLVSCVYIYLLISVHPINAARVKVQVKQLDSAMDQSQELMEELQTALEEDTQDAGQEYIGETWASCDQRKEDFERRSVKAQARYNEANKDGVVDTIEAAHVLLKMRSLAKTVSAAKNDACKWVEKQSADMSVMKELVSKTAGKNRCFEKSKAYMEAAQSKSEAEQGKAFGQSLRILLSGDKDCKPVKVKAADTVAQEKDEATEEVGAEEAAEELKQAAADAAAKAALLETTEKAVKFHNNATAELDFETQAVVGVAVHPILALVLGVIAFLLFIALSCVLVLAVLGFILGMIFCMLKMAFVAFIRIFSHKFWDFDFTGCLGFWLTGMAHPNAIGQCVVTVLHSLAHAAAHNDDDRDHHHGHHGHHGHHDDVFVHRRRNSHRHRRIDVYHH
jgi:chemotaxis protein histidine kinase CheA